MQKIITLPFHPVIGLEVTEDEWFSGKIERIVWSNTDKVFTVQVQDITPKEGITAELLLDVAIQQGWEIQD